MALQDLNQFNITLANVAAGTAVTSPLMKTQRKVTITAAKLGTNTTVTGSATHYATFRIKAGSSTIAYLSTVTSGGSTITLGVMRAMTLVSANVEQASAVNIVNAVAHAGSGTAVVQPAVQLEWRYRE